MSFQFVICPDPEEGTELTSANVFYANTPSQVEHRIKDAAMRYPASTICVYCLSEVLKLKNKPQYNRYTVSPNGEVVPQ